MWIRGEKIVKFAFSFESFAACSTQFSEQMEQGSSDGIDSVNIKIYFSKFWNDECSHI
jgi:hypothetical protein